MLRDIVYTAAVPASTVGNLLDVHLPEGDHTNGRPALLWTSGSAWLRDDGKQGAESIADQFTKRGYVVVGVSVRSSAQVTFPGQLHDIRAAVRFLRTNAATYGIDASRIAIMGNSSGGWTAAMAATTSSIARVEGEAETNGVSSGVQAAVAFFPPVDFLTMDEQAIEQHTVYGMVGEPIIKHDDPASPESLIVGGPIQQHHQAAAAASPLATIDGSEPPIAIFHGTHDPLIPPGQSQQLYEALRAAGAQVSLTLVDGAGHAVEPSSGAGSSRSFDVGPPLIDAPRYHAWRATHGTEVADAGVAPTWDAIADFLDAALGSASNDDRHPTF